MTPLIQVLRRRQRRAKENNTVSVNRSDMLSSLLTCRSYVYP